VLGLALQVTLRYEEWEVDVLSARRLDPRVDLGLDTLPNRIAPRSNHHGAAHRPRLRGLGFAQNVLVPAREIQRLRSQNRHVVRLRQGSAPQRARRPGHIAKAGCLVADDVRRRGVGGLLAEHSLGFTWKRGRRK
jgi:hypothetical protein